VAATHGALQSGRLPVAPRPAAERDRIRN
jgi:hypothetical protein